MIVTLFCDASWCPRTRAAGWGAWVKSDRVCKGHLYQGAFLESCLGAGDAEIMGATNALHYALRDGVAGDQDVILFQLDSMRAIEVIHGAFPAELTLSDVEQRAKGRLEIMRQERGLTFRTKHVKGHYHGDERTSRHSVNQACDRMARRQMEGMRARVDRGEPWPEVVRS